MKRLKFRIWLTRYDEPYMLYLKPSHKWYDYEDGYGLAFTDGGYDDFGAHERYDIKEEYPLMQFTGITDKHGNELYEGDIVLLNKKLHEIKYFDKWGMFGLVGKSAYKTMNDDDPLGSGGSSTSYKPYILGPYYQKRMELKGNIYENPNLLEDEISK